MHGEYTNPHPYSCTLQQKIGEIVQDAAGDPVLSAGIEVWDTTRSNSDLFIELDTGSSVPVIKVASSYNKYFSASKGATTNGNEVLMMYEASLASSTTRVSVIFKYFIFVDCLARADTQELIAPQQTLHGAFQIDGSTVSELVLNIAHPQSHSTFSQNNACPLSSRL